MKRSAIPLAAAAALLALASTGPPAAANNSTAGGEEAEPRICKRVAISGTRARSQRLCYTQQQWDEIARLAAEDLNQNRRPTNLEREAP